jgi:hypothetical protein
VDLVFDGVIEKLEEQIRSIRRLRKNLVALKAKCSCTTTIGECAIMKTLSDRDNCPCEDDYGPPSDSPEPAADAAAAL